jgi:hypothetical protein
MRNLHDVFLQIAADEGEHVSTMGACQVRGGGAGCPGRMERGAVRQRSDLLGRVAARRGIWICRLLALSLAPGPRPPARPPARPQDFSVAADLAAIKDRQRDEALQAVLGPPAPGPAAPSKPSVR